MAEYRKEYLGSDVYVSVSDEHGFGTDAVLLADFASPKRKENACDFGTGCGIIPMLWYRNGAAKHIWGLELQRQGYEQALLSAQMSNAQEKVTFLNLNLKNVKDEFEHASMDVVTMNPPYKAADAGIRSATDAALIARHEVECNLNDITQAAAHLLNFGGRLCMCNRPERLSDTLYAMKQAGIEPKRLRFVVKRPDTRPWLFLVEGKKGSKSYLNVEPMLIMYGDDGELSDEVIGIYGEYKENTK